MSAKSSRLLVLGATALAVRFKNDARKATGAEEAQRAGHSASVAQISARKSELNAERAAQDAIDAKTEAGRAVTEAERIVGSQKAVLESTLRVRLAETSASNAAERVELALAEAQRARKAAEATLGLPGPMGPMPRHEWNESRTRVRFEISPGRWGNWSAELKGADGDDGDPGKPGRDGGSVWGVGGGVSETRVLELIEDNMTLDSGETEHTHAVATVTASGDTDVLTPTAGKRLKIYWVIAVSDPDSSDSPLIKVKVGSTEKYRAYAISKRQLMLGAADEKVTVNLSAAGSVAVTIIYDEVDG